MLKPSENPLILRNSYRNPNYEVPACFLLTSIVRRQRIKQEGGGASVFHCFLFVNMLYLVYTLLRLSRTQSSNRESLAELRYLSSFFFLPFRSMLSMNVYNSECFQFGMVARARPFYFFRVFLGSLGAILFSGSVFACVFRTRYTGVPPVLLH